MAIVLGVCRFGRKQAGIPREIGQYISMSTLRQAFGDRASAWSRYCEEQFDSGYNGHAAQQATPPYGAPISLEQAKKVIAAAEAEAEKNKWFVAITVVDSGGFVVATHRLEWLDWTAGAWAA
jgi:hypothetical protein